MAKDLAQHGYDQEEEYFYKKKKNTWARCGARWTPNGPLHSETAPVKLRS